jgi:hypothetical protein
MIKTLLNVPPQELSFNLFYACATVTLDHKYIQGNVADIHVIQHVIKRVLTPSQSAVSTDQLLGYPIAACLS